MKHNTIILPPTLQDAILNDVVTNDSTTIPEDDIIHVIIFNAIEWYAWSLCVVGETSLS
jgi:hypothetical protein